MKTIPITIHEPITGRDVKLWHGSDAPPAALSKSGHFWINSDEYGGVPHVYNGAAWPARGVLAFGYDSAAYFTITQTDGAGVTFDSVSDGTAGFTFSDPVSVVGVFTVKYDALAYMTITQADGAGVTFDSVSDGTVGFTFNDPLTASRTLSSQTTEGYQLLASLTTDSTFLTGTDITYSGGRGSSILKLTGVWTGTSGGFEGIHLSIATSGALAAAGDGVIVVKGVVTNVGALTDGNIYGAQFIAKHNHATNTMANEAILCGMESIAYVADAGAVGTAIGANFVMRNYGGAGSVHRGVQIVLDQAGGTKATEATGLCIWNMAGTWDAAIRLSGAFGVFANFDDASTCYAVITAAPTTIAGQILVTMANGNPGYIPVYSTTGT